PFHVPVSTASAPSPGAGPPAACAMSAATAASTAGVLSPANAKSGSVRVTALMTHLLHRGIPKPPRPLRWTTRRRSSHIAGGESKRACQLVGDGEHGIALLTLRRGSVGPA